MFGWFLLSAVGTLFMVLGILNLFTPDGPPDIFGNPNLLLVESRTLAIAAFVSGLGIEIVATLSFSKAGQRQRAKKEAEEAATN